MTITWQERVEIEQVIDGMTRTTGTPVYTSLIRR